MIKLDIAADEEAPTSTYPVFRCPQCRDVTLLPWYHRARNHDLHSLISCMKEYDTVKIESQKEIAEFMECNSQHLRKEDDLEEKDLQNLARMATSRRAQKVAQFAETLTIVVHRAAMEGLGRISISGRAQEFYPYFSEIAERLFLRGIHSVRATPREFTIHILPPDDNQWGGEAENHRYDQMLESTLASDRI